MQTGIQHEVANRGLWESGTARAAVESKTAQSCQGLSREVQPEPGERSREGRAEHGEDEMLLPSEGGTRNTSALREACERAQRERLQLPWHPLQADFLKNAKTLHLRGLLRSRMAPLYVLELIEWAWFNRQSGRFRASEAAVVIEQAAGWEGEPGQLFTALLETRWLDQDEDGTVVIHGWEERAGKQYLKVFKDRDRHANPPQEEEVTPAPRSLHGASAEVPPLRNRDRRKRSKADQILPPPSPSEPTKEEEGVDHGRVEVLNELADPTPAERQEIADVVWRVVQGHKRDHKLPQDLRRPPATRDRPAFDEWAVRAAKAHGLINLLFASKWFHSDPAFTDAHWSTLVFMAEGVYVQRCHTERQERRKVFL